MKTIFLMLALLAGTVQAAPTFQAAGNGVGGANTVSPAWPVHVSGDVALLFVESTGGEPVTLSTPAGFVQVTGSPQATGTTTNGTQLTVFWARATSAAMAAPTVADPGDHVYARIFTYRGVINAGDPWDSTGGGVKAAASNTLTVTGITTTVNDTLVVQAASHDRDNTGAHFSNQTNVNLTGIVERSDAGTNSGNGGGFAVWDGVMATAGATGDTAASLSRSLVNAFLTIALRAVPPALPAATTNAATAITTSNATLNGTVSSNGATTTVVFDYGPDTSYGSTATAAQSPLASGATNSAVSAALIGLSCGTTYHFRVRATNSVGTTNGSDLNFTTAACPAPTATTNAASSLTTTSALLNGTVNDNGSVTTVTFRYGLTTAYGSTVTATQSPVGPNWGSMGVNATVSSLLCGTDYHYSVRAVSAAGTTDGADQLFTTAACPTSTSVTRSPGGCVDNGAIGTRTWTTLDAVASDNSFATTTLGDWQQSHYLVCTNYGFAIPAGSTITGIVVNVERSATGTNSPIRDLAMRAVKAGVIGATDRSSATNYTAIDTVEAHGGAADMWGTTWTVADINNANFGAALATYKNGSNGGTFTVNVDHMPVTVYYTPTTPWVSSITRINPNPTAANTSVSWDVLFSGNAVGVDIADFELVLSGAATGASITSVTGSGQVWTVTANTGTGATGTLGLNLADNDTITVGGVPLGGVGDNADFTGEVYTIEVPVCSGSMIYCDDFERANYGAVGNGWTITPGVGADCAGVVGNSGCAGIDTDIPPFNATTNRANPTRSMFTRWSIVTVESRPIDLSGHPSAILSFWMRRGGDSFSEYPEAVGEDYLVKYLDNTGTWRILAQYPTGVMQGQVFTPVIQLPPDAMHANFKLQFYQPAGSGDANGGANGGAPGVVGYDYWHFDNVIIVEAPESSYVGGFCDNFEAGLGRWSVSAEGAPPTAAIGDADLKTTDFLSATHELDLRWGYVVVSTLRHDMTGQSGDITYWIKRGTTAARAPDAGEDLVVEYFNSADTWVNLQTYTSTDAQAGTTNTYAAPIPADAKHTKFRLRFRQLNGSSFDNDYWHVDDVCVGTPQANSDLSITKTRSGPLVPGSQGTYILTVTNNGPQDMSGTIQVVDTLPTGLSYSSGTGTGWTCTSNAPDVTCSYVGSLANGASTPPITLVVAVDAGATGTITNTATVSGTVNDPNAANNTATNTATLTPGFVFTDGPCVHGIAFGAPGQTCNLVTWTSMTAGQDKINVYITSVNTSSVPNQLSGSVATTVNLEFGLSCHNPVADAGVQASFTATAEALPLCEPNGAAPTNWTTGVDFSFAAGSPSIGPYTFNYADVGQVELYARNSVATTQVGQSGPFVVRPAGFVLSQIRCTTANAANCGAGALPSGNNPGAASAAGATFIRAGDPFSVTVTAVNTLGDATPNYGMESSPESVLLTPANALANMVAAPAIAGSFGSFASGVATGTAFTWSEVGIITLSPRVGDGNYLGAGNVTGTTSGNVGRFYPHHFDTVVSQVAGAPIPCQPLPMVCPTNYNGIVYSGQEFGLTVTAMNAGGGVTGNYNTTTSLAKTAALTAVGNLGTDDAVTGAGGLGVPNVSAFTAGTITSNIEKYTFNAVSAPSDIYIRAIDTDSVSSKRLVDPVGTSEEGGVKVVSGRFKISNAYGSQQIPLLLTATVQYWDGAAWLTSSTDDITTFSTLTDLTKTIVSGPLAVANINAVGAGAVTVADGAKAFSLLAPGVAGSADIGLNAPAYLLTGGIPGRVTFGVYKNKNNYIYRREN